MTRSLYHYVDIHTKIPMSGSYFWSGSHIITNSKGEISLSIKIPSWNNVLSDPKSVGQEFLNGLWVSTVALHPIEHPHVP